MPVCNKGAEVHQPNISNLYQFNTAFFKHIFSSHNYTFERSETEMAPLVSSPWTIKSAGAAAPSDAIHAPKSFSEVMSEDLAIKLHDDEQQHTEPAKTADGGVVPSENHASSPSSGINEPSKNSSEADAIMSPAASSSSNANNVDIPLDCFENTECSDDLAIALALQKEFNSEYNDLIRRQEFLQNRNDRKIRVTYDKYRLAGENETSNDNIVDLDGPSIAIPDESDIPTFNSRGFCVRAKQVITKHDAEICGRRNASKLMAFPSNFNSGDDTGYGSRLSNRIYNELKQHSIKAEARAARRQDKKEDRATTEQIDRSARVMLFKMVNSGVLESVSGAISTGKEAIVFHAFGGETPYVASRSDSADSSQRLPNEVAIKMFKVTMSEFQNRDDYIKEDYRFKDRLGSKQNARKLIKLWTEKEFHNLKRLRAAGVPCPDPLILKKYTILMSFIGKDQTPAPQLKHAKFDSDADKIDAYEQTKWILKTMFQQARLVHADFSEYNLLWLDEKVWVIDVSQSVEMRHPSAMKFLYRDCETVTAFFKRIGTDGVCSVRELIQYVTGHQFVSDDSEELIYEMGNSILALYNKKVRDMFDDDRAESLIQQIKQNRNNSTDSAVAATSPTRRTAALSFAKKPKSRQKFAAQQMQSTSAATAVVAEKQNDDDDDDADDSEYDDSSDDSTSTGTETDEDSDIGEIPKSPDISSISDWAKHRKQQKQKNRAYRK